MWAGSVSITKKLSDFCFFVRYQNNQICAKLFFDNGHNDKPKMHHACM